MTPRPPFHWSPTLTREQKERRGNVLAGFMDVWLRVALCVVGLAFVFWVLSLLKS